MRNIQLRLLNNDIKSTWSNQWNIVPKWCKSLFNWQKRMPAMSHFEKTSLKYHTTCEDLQWSTNHIRKSLVRLFAAERYATTTPMSEAKCAFFRKRLVVFSMRPSTATQKSSFWNVCLKATTSTRWTISIASYRMRPIFEYVQRTTIQETTLTR